MASVNIRQRSGRARRRVNVSTSRTILNSRYARVIRPPHVALRRMTGRGSGQVASF